jgi:hypothetical protein
MISIHPRFNPLKLAPVTDAPEPRPASFDYHIIAILSMTTYGYKQRRDQRFDCSDWEPLQAEKVPPLSGW